MPVLATRQGHRAHLQTRSGPAQTRCRLDRPRSLDAYGVSQNTVSNVRTRFLRGGLEAVLSDQRQERRRQALSGAQQAHLIAIACSDVPDGHDHWTLRMLAGKAVELGFVEHIALETIRSLLKRTSSNPGSIASGASPA